MKRLLVVDDALLMRKPFATSPSSAGWEVAGGTRRYRSRRALCDAPPRPRQMDVGDAEDGRPGSTFRQIRAADPAAQVVMVTLDPEADPHGIDPRRGAIDFIVKPFDRDRVVRLPNKVKPRAPLPLMPRLRPMVNPTEPRPVRVLVVDDSASMREAPRRPASVVPAIEVVGARPRRRGSPELRPNGSSPTWSPSTSRCPACRS